MLLRCAMPSASELMAEGTIHAVYVHEGQAVRPGDKLFDVRVDLSAVARQDCPPIFYFRIVASEAAWVRRMVCAPEETHAVGAVLALASSSADEPLDGEPTRDLRVATFGIRADVLAR